MNIAWTDDLATGVARIDEQHRELIVIYNQLVDGCLRNEGPLHLAGLANDLIRKIKAHSSTEEEELASRGSSLTDAHSTEHADIIGKFEHLESRFLDGGNPDLKMGTLQTLGHELFRHTCSDDARCFAAPVLSATA